MDHAKNKVKFEDFTSFDKQNLIDLFVNNLTTYSYIYKSLFPTKLQEKLLKEKRTLPPQHTTQSKVEDDSYFMTEVVIEETTTG